ncbi:hypothetical protein ACOAKC_09350 [Hathewaya histolytica]|uniref:hypothetical protein n=1 Tax=Hathewaya histolytica TaxID=1498 RepID=UPI003B67B04D
MNNIYLPSLKSINIKNYSLYPNGLDFTYEFINGVNLIAGGNGIGKTTFINLIKYALIGGYKKGLDIRTYKRKKIEKRQQYANDYFRNRMRNDFNKNEEAKVTIIFSINEVIFQVTRSIYDFMILEVKVIDKNEYILNGKILKQDAYEKLKHDDKILCLQYIYEEKIKQVSNLNSFDDFIFFINEILIFGEDRKTILWDYYIQERLSSKYFNDPILDNEYEECKRNSKYYDSLSRHNSEDIRAINTIIDNEEKHEMHDDILKVNKKLYCVKDEIEKKNNELSNSQRKRKEASNKLKTLLMEKTNIIKNQQEIESKLKEEEKNIYTELWGKVNPKYKLFFDSIKFNDICPMCNQEIEEEVKRAFIIEENQCMLCKKTIKSGNTDTEKVKELKEISNSLLQKLQNTESEIYNLESELSTLDSEFNQIRIKIAKLQSELRDLEYKLENQKIDTNEKFSFKLMLNRINELEEEKKNNQIKSKNYLERANRIAEKMDENRKSITRELSELFSQYAGNFLGYNSYLTYDEDPEEDGKIYIPVINGSARYFQEELSESQAFFIDQSFRMSLLNYFYTMPSFFICETPDSSLDISYETNAANILLKYLGKPNCLILTSNLNNSEFLEYIIENSIAINYVNLLDIGNCSYIQKNSNKLTIISNRIEDKINEKRKNW